MSNDGRTRRRFLAGTGVMAAVSIAGCTGASSQEQDGTDDRHGTTTGSDTDHAHSEAASLDEPSASATVEMATASGGSHFEPHIVWVEEGGTVTWKLDSGSHTTTAYAGTDGDPQRTPDGADAWGSGTLSEQGKTFEHTFETTGVYDYYCVPHEATGMVGTVIVGDPDSEGQPGLQPPEDSLPDEAAAKVESLNERVTEALSSGSSESETTATSDGSETDGHH